MTEHDSPASGVAGGGGGDEVVGQKEGEREWVLVQNLDCIATAIVPCRTTAAYPS